MATTKMNQSDNVSTIVLFGKKFPNGRNALAQEELQIRNWIRTIQHIELLNGEDKMQHSVAYNGNKIVIEVNHGTHPIVISNHGEAYIQIMDNIGESRLGIQNELRKFIECL